MPYLEGQAGDCGPTANQYTTIDKFHELVQDVCNALGPSSGIDSADVDIQYLKKLMRQYDSDEQHWSPYAFADPSRSYTRNLVHDGNGKSNLLVVVWNPGKGSPIHDHANAHCVMKVLKGRLEETIYTIPTIHIEPENTLLPSSEDVPSNHLSELNPLRSTTYRTNEVTYISDQIGLHKIMNPTSEIAISLHLYTPPHAANFGFNLFDENTGKATHIRQAEYFSKYGKALSRRPTLLCKTNAGKSYQTKHALASCNDKTFTTKPPPLLDLAASSCIDTGSFGSC